MDSNPNAIDKSRIDRARQLADQLLQVLREDRDIRAANKQPGGRELSHAITLIEDGCMNFIRSQFADVPYSPMLKLKVAEGNTAQVSTNQQ